MPNMRQAIGVALVSAIAVLVTDVTFKSTLLRTLWPVILSPADGAITTAPVRVRWDGSQPLMVTLIGNGTREPLGLRESPFEIEPRYFPRPGQYGVELRSPLLGRWITSERRFLVRPPRQQPTPQPEAEPIADAINDMKDRIARLEDERQLLAGRGTSLSQENETLRTQNVDLNTTVDDLRQAQEQLDERLGGLAQEHAELAQAYQRAVEENRQLRLRLESMPLCTTWGYLSYPRPQTIPPTRRVVVVSNADGQIFRNQRECELIRESDRSAASVCQCVGSPFQG
jgi:regulator of replication initiation timing